MNITNILHLTNSIGKSTVERMKTIGIDSVEMLASASIESLLVIDEIGIKNGKRYIQLAKNHLEKIKARENIINIINKRGASNVAGSQEILSSQKPFDKKNSPKAPISAIKKLASSRMEDVAKLEESGIPNVKRYIEIANKYLESMRIKEEELASSSKSIPQKKLIGFVRIDSKSKPTKTEISPKMDKLPLKKPQVEFKSIKKLTPKNSVKSKPVTAQMKKQPQLKTFFSEVTMQRIRFLHNKIKKLEQALRREESFSFSELNNIIDYIKFLNVNYKTQSQIKIFKELNLTPSFYDPIGKKDIKIWDLIFECSRVLWIAAQAYSYLSAKFEEENLMENAIVAMVECSKMYKTAAYFSAACTRQEDKGLALSVENLEMNSEESRILAQNLATVSEEMKENFTMASNLSAGLSALTKRFAFLRKYDNKKKSQLKAQYNYDIGRACHLKAKSLLKGPPKGEIRDEIENLQKKANYYYFKAEEIWESMLKGELTILERKNIRINLSIVNENIIENDAKIINDKEAFEIQDPEPLIIIPENLAPFIPRTTNFLVKYKQADLNFDAYLRYKNLMSDVLLNFNKIDELRNNKAGIGRTLKQLKILYDNNDIDINSFTELFEKYSIKLEAIEYAIRNLKNLEKKTEVKKPRKKLLKPIIQ